MMDFELKAVLAAERKGLWGVPPSVADRKSRDGDFRCDVILSAAVTDGLSPVQTS